MKAFPELTQLAWKIAGNQENQDIPLKIKLPTMSLMAGYLLKIAIRELDSVRPDSAQIAVELVHLVILWAQKAKQDYLLQEGPSAGGKVASQLRKAEAEKRHAEILKRYEELAGGKTEANISGILARQFEVSEQQIRNILKKRK